MNNMRLIVDETIILHQATEFCRMIGATSIMLVGARVTASHDWTGLAPNHFNNLAITVETLGSVNMELVLRVQQL